MYSTFSSNSCKFLSSKNVSVEYLRKQLSAKAEDNVEIFRKGTILWLRSYFVDLNQYVPFQSERDLGIETEVISSQS